MTYFGEQLRKPFTLGMDAIIGIGKQAVIHVHDKSRDNVFIHQRQHVVGEVEEACIAAANSTPDESLQELHAVASFIIAKAPSCREEADAIDLSAEPEVDSLELLLELYNQAGLAAQQKSKL